MHMVEEEDLGVSLVFGKLGFICHTYSTVNMKCWNIFADVLTCF